MKEHVEHATLTTAVIVLQAYVYWLCNIKQIS